jgi:undecaprenyl diphosphate synthase
VTTHTIPRAGEVAPGDARAYEADGSPAPRHVAVIMDGNGRWAKARRLPRIAGHRRGVEAARKVVRAAGDLGIEVLTLYAFSSENWRRPVEEVTDLMGLLRHFILADIDELAEAGVRLRVIGNYRALKPDLVKLIDGALARTASNTGTTLVVALNYGAQNELAHAARTLAARVAAGEISADDITADRIEAELETHGLPPVDLLIRTSGEHRLSNFLLWQCAYAELLFVDTLWPDFDGDSLKAALDDFARRERRFGGL